MKRDEQLILKILGWVRDNVQGSEPSGAPDCREYDPETLHYHVKLCRQEGLIEADIPESPDGTGTIFQGITSSGHGYLNRNC